MSLVEWWSLALINGSGSQQWSLLYNLAVLGAQLRLLDVSLIGLFAYCLFPSLPMISALVALTQNFLFPLIKRNSSNSFRLHLTDQGLLSSEGCPYWAVPNRLSLVGCHRWPEGTCRTLFQSKVSPHKLMCSTRELRSSSWISWPSEVLGFEEQMKTNAEMTRIVEVTFILSKES